MSVHAGKMQEAECCTPRHETRTTRVRNAIKAGGATKESLMELIGATKITMLLGQLSFLNTRGENQAETEPEKAEFPMLGEDGVFFMGTLEQYQAKKALNAKRKTPGRR